MFCLSIDVNWVVLVADVNVGGIVNSVFYVLWFWCLIQRQCDWGGIFMKILSV